MAQPIGALGRACGAGTEVFAGRFFESAEGAGHPGVAQRFRTRAARLFELGPARRAHEEVIMHAAFAGWACLLILEFLQERFFFERALVEFREGVPRTDDQVDPVAGQEEDEDK